MKRLALPLAAASVLALSVTGASSADAPAAQWVTPREHIEYRAAKAEDGIALVLPIGSSSKSLRVNNVAWSPGGRYIASFGSPGDTARLWDARTGRLVRVLPSDKVAFHPKLGMASYAGNDLYEVATGKLLRCWPWTVKCPRPNLPLDRVSAGEKIPDIVFSGNGKWLAAYTGFDGCVRISDVAAGKQVRCLPPHPASVNTAAFSTNGKWLATGSTGTRVWDVATGRLLATLGEGGSVQAVSFSPDGRTLATTVRDGYAPAPEQARIELWDTATWARRTSFTKVWAESLAYSPDGSLLAVATLPEGTQIRDSQSGKIVRVLHGFREEPRGIAFSPDGTRLAGASMDGTVTIWDVRTGKVLAAMLTLPPAVMKPKDRTSGLVREPGNAPSIDLTPVPGNPNANLDPHHREWLVFTPKGYYDGSPDAEAFMQWETTAGRIAGSQLREKYRQPARVAAALTVQPR